MRWVHAARRVATDGTLALNVVSCNGDSSDVGVKLLDMMVRCTLMADGLRLFKKSRMKSYSVS